MENNNKWIINYVRKDMKNFVPSIYFQEYPVYDPTKIYNTDIYNI